MEQDPQRRLQASGFPEQAAFAALSGGLDSCSIRPVVDLVHGPDMWDFLNEDLEDSIVSARARQGAARLRLLVEYVERLERARGDFKVGSALRLRSAGNGAGHGVATSDSDESEAYDIGERASQPNSVETRCAVSPPPQGEGEYGSMRRVASASTQPAGPYTRHLEVDRNVPGRLWLPPADTSEAADNLCEICGQREAAAMLGHSECWECFGEH